MTVLVPILSEVLQPLADRVAERELRSTVRVDGFLAPIGDGRKNTCASGMYSGKSRRCGFTVQVIASWRGRLVMTGDPMPGAMHDARAWRESGLAQRFEGACMPMVDPAGSPTPATPAPVCWYPNVAPDQFHSAHTPASSTS